MSEATKRPWRAMASKINKGTVGILDEDTEPICFCDNPAQPNEANAALVVRAVNAHDDLVAACEQALRVMLGREYGGAPGTGDAIIALGAALEKAAPGSDRAEA